MQGFKSECAISELSASSDTCKPKNRFAAPLERRAALDQAAELRAREMAANAPEMKMAEEQSLDELLRRAGVLRYHRAQEHVEMQQGYANAAEVAGMLLIAD